MAGIALFAGLGVAWRLTCYVHTTVATDTCIAGLGVVKGQHERLPSGSSGVAKLASFSSNGMRGTLAIGDVIVMAVVARVRGLVVIKRQYHRRPHIGGMTGITLFGGHRMGGGFISPCANPVVTTGIVTGLPRHGTMVEHYL